MKRPSNKHSYLKRLPPEFYRGDACVHWSLVIQDRKQGWCKQDEERKEESIEAVCDYISRNPERAGLVPVDDYADYKFTGCLVPGYPELALFAADYWTRYWRIVSYLRSHGLQQGS